MQIHLIGDVDVFVFGATSGAVAAALAAKRQGCSVLAVSDRSYFGEETAGALQLWPEETSDHPLFTAVFGTERAPHPPNPGRVKHALDAALLDAGVPFLFDARPVFMLRGAQGEPAGVVLASRTALYGVKCRVAVDASRTGVLARLAGLPLEQLDQPQVRDLTVLSVEPPADSAHPWAELPSPFAIPAGENVTLRPAYRLRLEVTEPRNSLLARLQADHLDRAQLHVPGLFFSADTLVDRLGERLTGSHAPADDACTLPKEALARCGGRLVVANGLLPLTPAGARRLGEMAGQLALGERAGALAAEVAQTLPSVAGPYACTAGTPDAAGAIGETLPSVTPGDVRFGAPFLRPQDTGERCEVNLEALPLFASCDVLVAGGGTAGAPAGISAARAGARTVVLERLHGFGGVGTLGLITHYWFGNRVGFTAEVDAGVEAFAKLQEERSGWWSPEEKMGWYLGALRDAGAAAWLGSFAFGVQMEGDKVAGVLVSTPYGTGLVRAGAVIDATGNADLAAAAGAPCRLIEADHVAVQGTGLPPRRPGTSYRNSDHTFIDDTDAAGVTHAFVNARAKFTQEFDTAPIVDSRERRQIIGDFAISPLDLLAGRTYPDTVVKAASNFDTHGFTVHPVFMVRPPDKSLLSAYVPFRCLLPQGVEGLLVTGLGVSAHRDALPVIRMQADVQNQGYAAGLAAALSAAGGVAMRDLDVRALQARLVEKGVLDAEVLEHQDSFPLPEAAVREAAGKGPIDLFTTAVIMGYPKVSRSVLLTTLRTATSAEARADAALILGLWGEPEAAAHLAERVDQQDWDEGWNYTGMGQFGRSMSRLDAQLIALGKTGSPQAVEPVLRKIAALDETSHFSHGRAVSVAASSLAAHQPQAAPRLAAALHRLLLKPGMQGHAHLRTAEVVSRVNDSLVETEARNVSLKELILARGLYLCGDVDGLGEAILRTYAGDLRGHYARHAQAVLACDDLDALRRSAI